MATMHPTTNRKRSTIDVCEPVVLDKEVFQLVSVALTDALRALKEPDPDTFLSLQTGAARQATKEAARQMQDNGTSKVVASLEYRRAMAFQEVELDLALTLVGSIRRYVQLSRFWTIAPGARPHEN